MITVSIDCALLDKARIKEVTRKNGTKAKFIDLVLFESPNSQFGDYIVKQGVTKEERAAKLEMPILGNGKIWDFKKSGGTSLKHTNPNDAPEEASEPSDDIPF
jgi:hypothetical protein